MLKNEHRHTYLKYYTGVGPRDVSDGAAVVMTRLGHHLAMKGYILRSGGAGGSDHAFETGVREAIPQVMWDGAMEIYLPWAGFDDRGDLTCDYVLNRLPGKLQAWALARDVHTHWNNLKDGGRKLHSRNAFQVLGKSLNAPSDYIVYCNRIGPNGEPGGGTRTAVMIARKFSVREINIFTHAALAIVNAVIDEDWPDPLDEIWRRLQLLELREYWVSLT